MHPAYESNLCMFEPVAITGMGASGIRELNWRLRAGEERHVGASIDAFELPAVPEHVGRFSQLALAAAREAVADAGLLQATYESDRIAVILGVGVGNGEALDTVGESVRAGQLETVAPGLLEWLMPSVSTELLALECNATGPSCCIQTACASAAHALGYAFDMVRTGMVDAALVGGAEAPVAPVGLAFFERIGALSKYAGPAAGASRPFERDRTGFVMGEGAGMFVLESFRNARRRGAKIYAELAGYGATADAFHVTRPPDDGRGMCSAIMRALNVAGVTPTDVGYVNAHGTGTPFNDVAETLALKAAFGDHAKQLLVSSNKSMIGHLLGGAAAVETVATVYSLLTGIIPPTINLDVPDPACDLDYVPHVARERRVRVAVKNSFGFGGQNASLVLKAVDGPPARQ
jgi:3-oxoacyl-[acyl-carrier-protein] synthase II